MNSVILFSSAFLCLLFTSCRADPVDPHGHHGQPSVITEDLCKDPNACKSFPYSKCFLGPNKVGIECLCDPKLDFIELAKEDTLNGFRMQTCQVKDACSMPTHGCKDTLNATCHFQVTDLGSGNYQPLTFCTCNEGGRTLADRTHTCAETCHGECKNSDNCVYGSVGKDGKPEPVCNCKAGFTGSRCEKKVEEGKGAAGEAKSTTGYIVAIVILSVVSVIALAGVGVLFWKSRQ